VPSAEPSRSLAVSERPLGAIPAELEPRGQRRRGLGCGRVESSLVVKPQVVILRRRSSKSRTHALDCNWANGRHKLDYVRVDLKDLPPDQPRCSRCGGR
jgi:hypothetical protein